MEHQSTTRFPVATEFYPGDCKRHILDFIAGFKISIEFPSDLIGAVVPHAGWRYSGRTAARTIYCLSKKSNPEICIIFGADHTGVLKHGILPKGNWETPLGTILIDEELSELLLSSMPEFLSIDVNAHNREHSIEVITPMLKYFFPKMKIIPIIVRPEKSSLELGEGIGSILKSSGIPGITVASTDLTHYGEFYGFAPAGTGRSGFQWMRENDVQMIKLMESSEGEKVLVEARQSRNACGSGAVAAMLGVLQTLGRKKGSLVEYSTSHGASPESDFSFGVGYAGVVY
jgi:AmmeMemoRadiSam system protein B